LIVVAIILSKLGNFIIFKGAGFISKRFIEQKVCTMVAEKFKDRLQVLQDLLNIFAHKTSTLAEEDIE
jgi:hypothetical protein